MNQIKSLIDFLKEKQRKIKDIEASAAVCLEKGQIADYKKMMYEKAEILADLTDDSLKFLHSIPISEQDKIKSELNGFSINASEALELNSTFYMSALLYPEDYKPGDPNNLEKFISELEKSIK